MTSPTQRTLAYYRKLGWKASVVEKWNSGARVRQDAFGFIDILVLTDREIIGVQATSTGNVSSRVKKILGIEDALRWLRCGGRIQVVGWSKKGPRGKRKLWTPRILEITEGDFKAS